MGIDTRPPTGKLMLTVLGGIAQFGGEMMLERQREGVIKAKAAIARQLNIGEATVYRIPAAAQKKKA
jgi:DNA invertase Pin-like site-specific DNA recombinase